MKLFIYTCIAVFAAIFIETFMLCIQYKKNKMTEYFGDKDFKVHSLITSFLWFFMFLLFFLLQLEKHPSFHNIEIFRLAGAILLVLGLIVCLWAFLLMGIKRSLAVNFYRSNIPLQKSGIYKYLKNPETAGLCWALIGFAFFTSSLYNIIIAFEFTILMIPHTIIENKPLRNTVPGSEKLNSCDK
ncbi:MAG: methyltransferase [Elusimicrobiota bacterium]